MEIQQKKPSIRIGLPVVWGCPIELKPITGAPEGKMRLKFSNNGPARLFVKTASAIREFILEDHGETWFANPRLTQRRMERRPVCRAFLPGANLRKFKLFAFA